LQNCLQQPKELVLDCHVSMMLLRNYLGGFGLHKLDQVREQVDKERLLANLGEQFFKLWRPELIIRAVAHFSFHQLELLSKHRVESI